MMANGKPVPGEYGMYFGLHIILPWVHIPLLFFSRRNEGAGGWITSTASSSLANLSDANDFKDTDSNLDTLDDDADDDATEFA